MKKEFSEQERMKLAERIKYVRTEIAHQTQTDFALSLYVSRVYINRLEHAKTPFPTPGFFQRICDTYGVSSAWMHSGEEPIRKSEPSDVPDRKPLFSDEEEETLEIMQYQNKQYDLPESQLSYDKILSNHYNSLLSLDFKELLDPKTLSLEQYSELINTFILLYQPFLLFTKGLKEEFGAKQANLLPLYEEYLQNLEATIKIFFPK